MTPRTIAITAAALGLALSATGCSSGSSDETTPGTSLPTTISPSPSATAGTDPTASTPPSSTQEQGAIDAVKAFWAKLDDLNRDSQTKLSDLTTVARGQALSQWQTNITAARGRGQHQVGAVTIAQSTATKAKKNNVWNVRACIDVSDVNVVDQDGKSVIAAGRRPRNQYTYQVTADGSSFYVTKDNLEGSAC